MRLTKKYCLTCCSKRLGCTINLFLIDSTAIPFGDPDATYFEHLSLEFFAHFTKLMEAHQVTEEEVDK